MPAKKPSSTPDLPDLETNLAAILVAQGKVLDYIDGQTQRDETPEEYVRQEIAKSLVREYGFPKDHIAVEFTLALGSRKPRADLVIFGPGQPHKQENARLIVECKEQRVKSADKKDGIGQLHSYMSACPNATHGMWTNGLERLCYRKVTDGGEITYVEIPEIPGFGQDEEETDRPTFDSLKPASSDALLFAFRRCHNYIAGNQGIQKQGAFWELLKLIFCKIHDERNSDEVEFYAAAKDRASQNGQMRVRYRLGKLFEAVRQDYPSIFQANEEILLEPRVLTYLVSQLQMYSLLESDIDVKGRAYEEIVGSNLRGDRGEFFTPRNICRMAVEMLDPEEKQVILDPAQGTGGFLITAMNHVIDKIRRAEENKWKNADRAGKAVRERIQKYAHSHVVGIDFNPELVKAAKMNMVMNNDGAGGLYQANSLLIPMEWPAELRDRNLIGGVDLLVTNPPFGSKIPVDDPRLLEQFELARSWSYDADADTWRMGEGLQKSQPPEILFIERCVQFLRPGNGRMAIVLPDGILGSPGLGYVRQWILQQCRVLASIDLHPDTFQPHVSVQTSILVLQRKTAEQIKVETAAGKMQDYSVFMALANHIGHDKRGNKTYVRDRKGNEVIEEVTEQDTEWVNGKPVVKNIKSRRKVEDDNTRQIAAAFRSWLSQQD